MWANWNGCIRPVGLAAHVPARGIDRHRAGAAIMAERMSVPGRPAPDTPSCDKAGL